jgi:protein KTI12
LYELEQITNDIVSTIISSQNVIMCGDYIVIKGTSERIVMPQRINISELRTIRSQFVKFSELHPPNNVKDIPKHFVIFLNSKLK